MSARFHIGPFYFSQRLGRTQAQEHAAAKARAQRQAERERRRAIREAQRPEVIAAAQARQEEYRQQEQARLEEEKARLEECQRRRADRDSRTRRGVIAECRIDPLNGGSFTIRNKDTETVFDVDPNAAIHFLSLKKGDVVQLTFAPGNTGLEAFFQLSRATGAKPRSPVTFTSLDKEWLGLAVKVSPPPGS